jgi:hypothetical protein
VTVATTRSATLATWLCGRTLSASTLHALHAPPSTGSSQNPPTQPFAPQRPRLAPSRTEPNPDGGQEKRAPSSGVIVGTLASGVVFRTEGPCAELPLRQLVASQRTYSDEKLQRIVTLRFGTGRQRMALERWTNPKLSRRACTCEYGLQFV